MYEQTNEYMNDNFGTEMNHQRDRIMTAIIFLALGLGIGGLLALLSAPRSGVRTRAKIAHTLEDRLGSSRDGTNKTIHRLERDFSDLRQKVEERLTER